MLVKRPLKLLLATAWLLIAAELFLRLFHPVPVVPRYIMAAPFGIRVNQPNKTYTHTSADFSITIRTNSRGIRADEEIPYAKPPGLKRIVVLGDSFSMGYEVNLEDSFLHLMESQLRQAGHNVQVVNLSVSGHGNAEQLIMLREEGLKYQPDLVLLCWNSTDFLDNPRSGLFALDNGQLVQTASTYLPGVATQDYLNGWKIYEWTAAHSMLYSFIREWLAFDVIKPLMVAFQGNADALEGSADQKAPDSYPAELCIALLKETQRLSNEAGAQFLILDIPLRRERVEYYSVFPRDPSGQPFGLPLVSPIPDFMQHTGQLIYWERSQGHYTPLGCRLVAHRLAHHILTHNLLRQP